MKPFLSVGILALGMLLTQCAKEPTDHLTREESRIYVTNYDTTVNFNQYKTFRIADSVANIDNNQLASKTRTELNAQMIDHVKAALIERGYVPVGPGDAPDLGVTISTITNTSSYLVDYSMYDRYYGGYWDPYQWGYPGYSYYFPSYGIYQSDETALSIDIIDVKNASQNGNRLEAVWSGLIRGSGIFSTTTIGSQLDALFQQSPYLKTN